MGYLRRNKIYSDGYNNALKNLIFRLECNGDVKEYRRGMIRQPKEYSTPARDKEYKKGYAAGNVFGKLIYKECNQDIEKLKIEIEKYKKCID